MNENWLFVIFLIIMELIGLGLPVLLVTCFGNPG